MERERLLAFTDGLIAVIITIMVLEMGMLPPALRTRRLAVQTRRAGDQVTE